MINFWTVISAVVTSALCFLTGFMVTQLYINHKVGKILDQHQRTMSLLDDRIDNVNERCDVARDRMNILSDNLFEAQAKQEPFTVTKK
jgi:uncharacterized protein YoxC